ncbi:MAG: EAL and HDOD domain-containing protein [Candidatus Acidiferrales bacterium]
MRKFLARQPIFNSHRVVFGYELLFRGGPENYFEHPQPDVACASATDSLFLFGIERLAQGRRVFVNCTREFFIRDFPFILPKDSVVLEVLEDVVLDDKLIAACRRLKHAGYLLALDDFRDLPEWGPLVAIADFIKVDLLATPEGEQLRLARQFSRGKVLLVAEKVETYRDFERTRDWGYSYFQGYFFSRPQVLSHHDVPAYKLGYLRILQAANGSPVDMQEIAERIKRETSLSYRLLRYLNSPALFLSTEIRSIPHALMLLGERGVRRWVSLVAVACMGHDKPPELVTLPLIRARFCELLAPAVHMNDFSNDLFLLGLLSAIDAILDMEMADILREVTLREEIRDALLGENNSLRRVLEVVLLYERAAWEKLDDAAAYLGISPESVPEMFLESVDWARRVFSGQQTEEVEST